MLHNPQSAKTVFVVFGGIRMASDDRPRGGAASEPLLVLPGVDPGDDLLELPLGLAGGEVGHVVVLRGGGHQPLGLHVHARPDVVLQRGSLVKSD